MGFDFSSLAGGPGGGFLGNLFGGGGAQSNAATRAAVANQDALGRDRPFYAAQLRQLYEDPEGFLKKIPGYQFQLDQGEEAIKRNAAATGELGSGNLSADLVKYSQGLASNSINQYTTILAGLAESGDPRYAALETGGANAQISGNQAIGGNVIGFLSSLFGGGGNSSTGSGFGSFLGGLFGGSGGGGGGGGSDGISFDVGSYAAPGNY